MRIAFSEICKRSAATSTDKQAAFPDVSAPAAEVLRAWEELSAVMHLIDSSQCMTEREMGGLKRLYALEGELLSILLRKYGVEDVEQRQEV